VTKPKRPLGSRARGTATAVVRGAGEGGSGPPRRRRQGLWLVLGLRVPLSEAEQRLGVHGHFCFPGRRHTPPSEALPRRPLVFKATSHFFFQLGSLGVARLTTSRVYGDNFHSSEV